MSRLVLLLLLAAAGCTGGPTPGALLWQAEAVIRLPKPRTDSEVSFEEAVAARRSVRAYRKDPLSLAEVSQLLWAAQGITGREGKRAAPSAGALYPLEIYVVAGRVEGLSPGAYKYRPRGHALVATAAGDVRARIADAAVDQDWMARGAIQIVIAGVYKRTTVKYGERGKKYVHMEAGHVAQNIYLQATALGLGTTVVGAFEDNTIKSLLNMPREEHPLSIMPVGRRR